jgi:MFS superfamily sulfate permease-like transporter
MNMQPEYSKMGEVLKRDLPASVMVFLVALPLCLGIALASGASAFAGIVTGVIGGIVIGAISGSQVSVSGPAAGLTVVVLNSIETLGSFPAFLTALVLAGLLQIVLGIVKAGVLSNFFPSAVIRGMLAAIGIILILKQIPHGLGYDFDYEGDMSFMENATHNTFTDIVYAFLEPAPLAIVICLSSLILMMVWDGKLKHKFSSLKVIPGALIAVLSGVLINLAALNWFPQIALRGEHLVSLPSNILRSGASLFEQPDFSVLYSPTVYIVALTIALIASIETLLSIEATDKLDPEMRITPLNRELIAQGLGNTLLGFIGGIPATAVIVRSSANILAGAASKWSAIIHGLLLVVSVLTATAILNLIPLASLAAILLLVGYKLASPSIFGFLFKQGYSQFIPFIITLLAIVFTDLLVGIGIGLAIGIAFMIFTNLKSAVKVTSHNNLVLIRLRNNVTFMNKYQLRNELRKLKDGSEVMIDLRPASFIDHDIAETLEQFIYAAKKKNMRIEIKKTPRQMTNKKFKHLSHEDLRETTS